jgi:hypothetical protein
MGAHLKYWRYIIRHKWFVFVAGRRTGAPLWRLIIHDWSKFLPSEWRAYVRKFHGRTPSFGWLRQHYRGRPNDEQNAKDYKAWVDLEFNVAWLKHQHRNPHHWQHWMLAEDNPSKRLEVPQTSGQPRAFPLPIPEHFIREMVADWMGAGRAITGRWECAEWYEKNRDNLVLEHQTRIRVEGLLTAHAGLRCLWGCQGGSPTYCKDLGGCEAHSSRFSKGEREQLAGGSWRFHYPAEDLAEITPEGAITIHPHGMKVET